MIKLGMVAGEASGDLLGAGLLGDLQHQNIGYQATGIAGPAMLSVGCRTLFDMDRLSVTGFIEPLFRLHELFRMRKQLYHYFLANKPDVFVGIDSPDFNLGLELRLRRAGIPIIHYVSPSVWAWRQKRIINIAAATDLVLTLFPFETAFYETHHVPAKCVGHPLADQIPLHPDKKAARSQLNLEQDAIYIALLPGSRANELHYLSEVFIQAAVLCRKKRPPLRFITSAINPQRFTEFQQTCQRIAPTLPMTYFQGQSHAVMAAADVILLASGTASLEAMLFKRPMVIAYRMAPITYHLAKYLVNIPYIGLPNILSNRLLVPEFIQQAVTPDHLMTAILHFIDHPEQVIELEKTFCVLHKMLRRDANRQAGEAVIELIKRTH